MRFLISFIFIVSALAAQQPGAAQPPPNGRTFTAIGWFDAISDLGVRTAANKLTYTMISSGSRSAPLSFSGQSIDLYREVAGEKGPELRLAVSIPVAETIKKPLVVLFADKVSTISQQVDPATVKYQFFVVEDALDFFPTGSGHFVNFTPYEILSRFGGKDARIERLTSQVILPTSATDLTVRLQVASRDVATGETQFLINAPLRRAPEQRIMAFLYHTPANGVETRFIYDTPAPPEPAPR
jgi:hypothetical protein